MARGVRLSQKALSLQRIRKVIHGDDPHNSQERPDDSKGGELPPIDKGEYTLQFSSLEELSAPPRGSVGTRMRKLFDAANEVAISDLSDVLWSTEQPSALAYFGYRLADALSPKFAGLACEVLRRKSFHCTQELLGILAQREYCHFMLGQPPVVAGPEFREFRVALADLCVSPECHFLERDWKRYNDEILSLTTFPLTILRRSAGAEIDGVLLNAAIRGGLDQSMNKRAVELLTLRESSDPTRRVLPASEMSEIARATDNLLRDPFNKLQLFSLLDKWASKNEEELPSSGECAIRDQLLCRWTQLRDQDAPFSAEDNSPIYEVVRILRHFKDPLSGLVLKEATNHSNAGVRILARLALDGPREETLDHLRSCLRGDEGRDDQLTAVRVFGYHISPAVDRLLAPILRDFARETWKVTSFDEASDPLLVPQRIVLLQGMIRRFYTEDLNSAFLKPVFDSFGTDNHALRNVALNTYVQACQIGRIPPPGFYDHPELLSSLQKSIQILSQVESKEEDGGQFRNIAHGLQALFVFDGPAAYGFELEAMTGTEEDSAKG